MSYIRVKWLPNGANGKKLPYQYEVESYRDDEGKPRQRHLAYIGAGVPEGWKGNVPKDAAPDWKEEKPELKPKGKAKKASKPKAEPKVKAPKKEKDPYEGTDFEGMTEEEVTKSLLADYQEFVRDYLDNASEEDLKKLDNGIPNEHQEEDQAEESGWTVTTKYTRATMEYNESKKWIRRKVWGDWFDDQMGPRPNPEDIPVVYGAKSDGSQGLLNDEVVLRTTYGQRARYNTPNGALWKEEADLKKAIEKHSKGSYTSETRITPKEWKSRIAPPSKIPVKDQPFDAEMKYRYEWVYIQPTVQERWWSEGGSGKPPKGWKPGDDQKAARANEHKALQASWDDRFDKWSGSVKTNEELGAVIYEEFNYTEEGEWRPISIKEAFRYKRWAVTDNATEDFATAFGAWHSKGKTEEGHGPEDLPKSYQEYMRTKFGEPRNVTLPPKPTKGDTYIYVANKHFGKVPKKDRIMEKWVLDEVEADVNKYSEPDLAPSVHGELPIEKDLKAAGWEPGYSYTSKRQIIINAAHTRKWEEERKQKGKDTFDPKTRPDCPSCGGKLDSSPGNDYRACSCGYYQGTLHDEHGVWKWTEHYPKKGEKPKTEPKPKKDVVPKSDEPIKFTDDGDALGQEWHGTIHAKDPETGEEMGMVSYSTYNGETYIKHIEVEPKYRRRGVGTALINKLREEHGITDMQGGFATKEGQALAKKAIPEIEKARNRVEVRDNSGQAHYYDNRTQYLKAIAKRMDAEARWYTGKDLSTYTGDKETNHLEDIPSKDKAAAMSYRKVISKEEATLWRAEEGQVDEEAGAEAYRKAESVRTKPPGEAETWTAMNKREREAFNDEVLSGDAKRVEDPNTPGPGTPQPSPKKFTPFGEHSSIPQRGRTLGGGSTKILSKAEADAEAERIIKEYGVEKLREARDNHRLRLIEIVEAELAAVGIEPTWERQMQVAKRVDRRLRT